MAPKLDLSIVILVLNEADAIADVLRGVREALSPFRIQFEIVLIDGGSVDGTRDIGERLGALVHIQRRPGYGGALREGFEKARGQYVVTLDGDGSHPPSLIAELWRCRDKGDLIIGSRFVAGGASKAPPHRRTLSSALNGAFDRLLKIGVKDYSSGLRIYRRNILSPHKYASQHFDIIPEVLVRAVAEGYSVAELPFQYEERKGGASHVNLFTFSLSYLSTLYRMWKLRNSIESADYDHRAYDSWIPLQRYWQRRRFSIVTGFLHPGGTVLDIGCGSSRIIQSNPHAIAMDFAIRKLRFLKKTNQRRVQASTFELPFPEGVFDQVIHSQVIEHIPFDRKIFTELARVLKVGGILVIGTPDYGRPWWPIIEFFYGKLLPNAYADEHITHYTFRSLTDVLAENGFRCLAYRYILGGELVIQAVKV